MNTLKEVIEYKINYLNKLSEVRASQKEITKKYGNFSCYDEKLNIWVDVYKEHEKLENEIPQSLYKTFGYLCQSKKGEILQTYDIQLENDKRKLNKILKLEI